MVVEAAPVVPGDENGGTVGDTIPILAVHDCIDIVSHKILRRLHEGGWMISEIT